MYYRYWTCCDSTQISPRSKECRSAHDECDLAEYCDGTSTECPEDVFAVNGLQCDGGQGYCHNGQCPQRPNQCVKMYGPGVCVCVCVCVVSLYTTLLCWSRCNKRCDRLLSSGATEARQYCYEQNTRGTYFAFCKRPSDNIWIPCQGPWVSASRVTICSRPESSEGKSSSE